MYVLDRRYKESRQVEVFPPDYSHERNCRECDSGGKAAILSQNAGVEFDLRPNPDKYVYCCCCIIIVVVITDENPLPLQISTKKLITGIIQ